MLDEPEVTRRPGSSCRLAVVLQSLTVSVSPSALTQRQSRVSDSVMGQQGGCRISERGVGVRLTARKAST